MMLLQRMMWIIWPAFLVAGLLEVVVFAFVDPQDLTWFGDPLAWSRESVYTVAFFVFWGVAGISSALTMVLATPADEVNR